MAVNENVFKDGLAEPSNSRTTASGVPLSFPHGFLLGADICLTGGDQCQSSRGLLALGQ